jgi:hypothetical protein
MARDEALEGIPGLRTVLRISLIAGVFCDMMLSG